MKIFQGRSAHYSRVILFTVGFFCLSLCLTASWGVLWAKPSAQDFLMACYLGTTEEVKKGIEAGADVNAVSPQKYTPLMAAILGRTDSLKKVEMLLAAKADPYLDEGKYGFTAFSYAMADISNLPLLKVLLESDTNINDAVPSNISNFLIEACINSQAWPDEERVILLGELLRNEADVKFKNKKPGVTALFACASTAGPKTLSLLLKAGAEVDATSSLSESTALLEAARYNANPESVILLLEHGANPDTRDKRGENALELAQRNSTLGASRIQKILRNLKDKNKWQISKPPSVADFILSCYLGTVEEMQRAIESGVEVNVSEKNITPLIAAILGRVNSLEKVDLLLKAKANPNLKTKNGTTPLHAAVGHGGNIKIVSRLLESKADINAANDEGDTPFIVAASNYGIFTPTSLGTDNGAWAPDQHALLLDLLLKNGADARDDALFVAAGNAGPKSLQILIEAGIDVNAVGYHNSSPLIRAVRMNPYPESIRLLLDSGANLHYSFSGDGCPKGGCTALFFSDNKSVAAEEIKKILREAVKKQNQQTKK